MVNIRADEDLTPDEVLQGFSEADDQDVKAMSRDPQVREIARDDCKGDKQSAGYRVLHLPDKARSSVPNFAKQRLCRLKIGSASCAGV